MTYPLTSPAHAAPAEPLGALPPDAEPATTEGLGITDGAWRNTAPPIDWAGSLDLGWSWRRIAIPAASTATAGLLTAVTTYGVGLWAGGLAALGSAAGIVVLAHRNPE
jgi:hypothetical protein